MICSKCNNQLPDGAKFCDYCGTRFDLVNTQQTSMYANGSAGSGNMNSTESNNDVEKTKKKPSKGIKPLIFIIVTVVLCLALAASVFVIFGQLGKIDDLEKLAEVRKETISSLETELSDANETIADLEDEISGLEDEIEDLESEILGLEDEIWNMEDVIVGLEDEISSLENSGGDENSAKQVEVIAELLNDEVQHNSELQTLSALGLTVKCEARGTELVMAFIVTNAYLENMDFSDIIDGMDLTLEQVREMYPVISNIVFEVRRADGTVIFSRSLVESVSDNESVKKLADELNASIKNEETFQTLKEAGLEIAFEARGSEFVILYIISDDLLGMMSEESFSGMSDTISSYASADDMKKECPDITKIIIEVRKTDGTVVYSEEMK